MPKLPTGGSAPKPPKPPKPAPGGQAINSKGKTSGTVDTSTGGTFDQNPKPGPGAKEKTQAVKTQVSNKTKGIGPDAGGSTTIKSGKYVNTNKDTGGGGGKATGGGGGGGTPLPTTGGTRHTRGGSIFGAGDVGSYGGGFGGDRFGGSAASQPPQVKRTEPTSSLDGGRVGGGFPELGTGYRPPPAYFDTGAAGGGGGGAEGANPLAGGSSFTNESLDEVLHGGKKKGRIKRARGSE